MACRSRQRVYNPPKEQNTQKASPCLLYTSYATFTGEDGSRYAVTLEDEDTLALKVYLEGQESYLSLVNTVYFARQEAMG